MMKNVIIIFVMYIAALKRGARKFPEASKSGVPVSEAGTSLFADYTNSDTKISYFAKRER